MIRQLCAACGIAIAILIVAIHQDPWVRLEALSQFKHAFETSLDCSLSCNLGGINFLKPEIDLRDVVVRSRNAQSPWEWRCSRYVTGFSWLHFAFFGMIDMYVAIENLHIHSDFVDGVPAVNEHIAQLFKGPDFPVASFLKSVTIDDAFFSAGSSGDAWECHLHWRSASRKINERFRTTMQCLDGTFTVDGIKRLTDLFGTLAFDSIDVCSGNACTVRTDCRFMIPQWHDAGVCFLSGSWDMQHGRFWLRNAEQSCTIDPIVLTMQGNQLMLRATAHAPVECIAAVCGAPYDALPIQGAACARLSGMLSPRTKLNGYVMVDQVRYKGTPWHGTAHISCTKDNEKLSGEMVMRHPKAHIAGNWQWDAQTQHGTGFFENKNCIDLPWFTYWKLAPNACTFSAKKDDTGIVITHECTASHHISDASTTLHGTARLCGTEVALDGHMGNHHYQANANLAAYPYLVSAECTSPHDATVLTMGRDAHDSTMLVMDIHFPLVRSLSLTIFGYDTQGEGILRARVWEDQQAIRGDITLVDATIRLAHVYNFIDGGTIRWVYAPEARKFTCEDVYFSLHSGSILSRGAVVFFDTHYAPYFVHAPLLFDRCLLNMNEDLFAMFSGALSLTKRPQTQPHLKGHVIIDRSHLKENLFSDAFQRRLFAHTGNAFDVQSQTNISCDMSVETREPVRVETGFLQSSAQINLHIGRTLFDPAVVGSVKLSGGKLAFPYKPLYISKGTLTFFADQLYNPSIELIARNKIKKYDIGLHVTGSLSDHHILLESAPPLTDEQIVSLLLVGSKEESLNVMMPALIMQNVKSLIFGTNQSSLIERYFHPLVKSLSINLVPSFTDQTGRGGLRGAIEIDVNDRLRAIIQKNFSLTEDTRFEIEYQVSDDMTVRAIRDERRDIGGEVEMRWKF